MSQIGSPSNSKLNSLRRNPSMTHSIAAHHHSQIAAATNQPPHQNQQLHHSLQHTRRCNRSQSFSNAQLSQQHHQHIQNKSITRDAAASNAPTSSSSSRTSSSRYQQEPYTLNSLWSVWYGTAAIAFQVKLNDTLNERATCYLEAKVKPVREPGNSTDV